MDFSNIELIEPPKELSADIVSIINKKQAHKKLLRSVFSVVFFSLFSIVSLVFSWALLVGQMTDSGFIYILYSGLNDYRWLSYAGWDYLFALLETIPLVALLIFSLIILVSILTLGYVSKKIKYILNNNFAYKNV